MTSPLLFLALPSAVALALLLAYLGRNLEWRRAAGYLGAAAAYGFLRGTAIHWISDHRLGAPFPYRIHLPVVALLGVSLQEVVGWSLAAGLAAVLADRLLARLRAGAGPYRVAALAAGILAAICLAVENAAIRAGWWSWTIALPPAGRLLPPVPRVALLDWGFVAFDFLLPFLLFAVPSSLASRLAGLALFPIHLLAHTLLAPLPEPLPLAGNDLLHAGIVAYVLARAVGDRGDSALPPPERERWRLLPLVVAGLIAGATAAAAWAATGGIGAAAASLPLLAVALGTVRSAKNAVRSAASPPRTSHLAPRTALVLLVFLAAYALRAPASRRQRDFLRDLERGVAALNAGNAVAAEGALRQALRARPDQVGGRTLLAMALLRQGRRDGARAELEAALAAAPDERDPLILLTSLDLAEGRTAEAAERAARGRRAHPERPEFVYQAALAAGTAGPGRPAAAAAIAIARRGGREPLASLVSLAGAFADRATADECRAALAALP